MKPLLTDEEILEAIKPHDKNSVLYGAVKITSIAQDKKTHQADVDWLDSPCTEHEHHSVNGLMYIDDVMSNPIFIMSKEGIYYIHRKDCPECWQEFKHLHNE